MDSKLMWHRCQDSVTTSPDVKHDKRSKPRSRVRLGARFTPLITYVLSTRAFNLLHLANLTFSLACRLQRLAGIGHGARQQAKAPEAGSKVYLTIKPAVRRR